MPNNVKILLSNNPDRLAAELAKYGRTGTVEAEYGDVMVEGSVISLGHHGPRSGNPCPCLAMNQALDLEAIGISHVDLDTVGGVAALLGVRKNFEDAELWNGGYDYAFWEAAAYVDIHGPHRLKEWQKKREDLIYAKARGMKFHDLREENDWVATERGFLDGGFYGLDAWWAWSKTHRAPFTPRDGSVIDVTEYVLEAVRIANLIAEDCCLDKETEQLIEAGYAFAAEGKALNESSFVREEGGVILRSAKEFVNHLYETPDGTVAQAVVAMTRRNAEEPMVVTVSLADPVEGVSCRAIVQALWGPLAGGHDGIAGSPRGTDMTASDAEQAFNAVVAALAACVR